MDLIGPYTIHSKRKKYTLQCMTMIDPVTNWFEIAKVNAPSSAECQRAFDSTWLARYLRPKEISFDNGENLRQSSVNYVKTWVLRKSPLLIIIHKGIP